MTRFLLYYVDAYVSSISGWGGSGDSWCLGVSVGGTLTRRMATLGARAGQARPLVRAVEKKPQHVPKGNFRASRSAS